MHVLGALMALATALAGCNRAYYRRQADTEAHELIQEKANNPHWALENYSVFVDPRSRMFDPFSADTPPMPQDDPTSHELMHYVDGKRGYPGWHYSGDTDEVENPVWLDYVPRDEQGVLHMDAEMALKLARLHNRTFQQEVEELYLSALDVSFERFRFDTQFFAGYQTFGTWSGKDRSGNGGQSSSVFSASTYSKGRNSSAWQLQRSFTNGADLVVGLANSLVWQVSGPDDYRGSTLLDFTLLQPLLRGAGKDRVLERLTVAERTLLANVRAMERYRQAFHVDVMTGRASANTGPTRRGGVLGGSGLDGFSGVGSGGFGRLATGGATQTGQTATGAGGAQIGGFLGLLQTQMQIRNSEINIRLLRSNLSTLEDKDEEIGDVDPRTQQAQTEAKARQRLQVIQARQAMLLSESRLINTRNTFQSTLDNFKINLGLPPTLCMRVADPMIDRLYLIDDGVEHRRQELEELRPQWGQRLLAASTRVKKIRKEVDGNPVDVFELEWSDDVAKDIKRIIGDLDDMNRFTKSLNEEEIRHLIRDQKTFEKGLPDRVAQLSRLRKKYDELRDSPCPLLPVPDLDPVIFDPARIETLRKSMANKVALLRKSMEGVNGELAAISERGKALAKDGPNLNPDQLATQLLELKKDVNAQLDLLRNAILALELVQAQLRAESINLVPVDLPAPAAVEIAHRYRHDLMNARASLVDSWRLIEFNADNLESTLDVVFSGDVANRTDNPLKVAGATGRLRVGLQFDAPIVRLSERNTYRQSLIEFQQARRNFYAALDSISQTLRATLRTMETSQINFEFQRYAVSVASEQNDLNTELLSRPGATGPTAARDTVQALSDLLNAQNDFLSIWVSYEALRRQLDLDLGTMRIDSDGRWLDPGPIGPDYLERVQESIDYSPPEGWTTAVEEVPTKLLSPTAVKGRRQAAPEMAEEEDEVPAPAPQNEAGEGEPTPAERTPVDAKPIPKGEGSGDADSGGEQNPFTDEESESAAPRNVRRIGAPQASLSPAPRPAQARSTPRDVVAGPGAGTKAKGSEIRQTTNVASDSTSGGAIIRRASLELEAAPAVKVSRVTVKSISD